MLSATGTAFSYAKYNAGVAGFDEILERYPKISRDRLKRINGRFDPHGSSVLLLTGIPGLDIFVALPARASGAKKKTFIIWAAIAKLLRWSFLAIVVLGFYMTYGQWAKIRKNRA